MAAVITTPAGGIIPSGTESTVTDRLVLAGSTSSTSSRPTSTLSSSTSSSISTHIVASQTTSIAASIAASSTSSSSDSSIPAGYLSPAVAAGIGIGSAVGGALISLFFFWLLTRGSGKRNRAYNDETNMSTRGLVRPPTPEYRLADPLKDGAGGGLGMMEKATPLVSMREVSPPSPTLVVDEQAVKQPWAALEARVRSHVGNMYHQQYVQPSVFRSETLGALGYNRQSPALSQLVELLANVATRASTLSYLLAVVISQRLDFAGNPKTTFLPPELIACMRAMNVQTAPKDKLLAWRTATSTLTQKTYTNTAISRNDPRSSAINSAINALMPLLRPLVHENCAAKAFEDLEDIFEDAAKFGLAVFGSNGLWGFEWERGERAFKDRKEAPGWPALKRLYTESEPRAPPPVGGPGLGGRRRSLFRVGGPQ